VPVEYVSPEQLDCTIGYDEEHPEVLAKCLSCGHEWAVV
jgi:hypothetical protein